MPRAAPTVVLDLVLVPRSSIDPGEAVMSMQRFFKRVRIDLRSVMISQVPIRFLGL
jgi:hypothetical protein